MFNAELSDQDLAIIQQAVTDRISILQHQSEALHPGSLPSAETTLGQLKEQIEAMRALLSKLPAKE